MDLEYFYCDSCGYEDRYISIDYERTVANGDICLCPLCEKEVIIDEDWIEE